ncbi:MAG: beta-N-acetylhexosaminidase [Hyphomicrobiales bacterium]|jgi:beta-N-acetylhexosaminidase|nr:beta-N-acetylhexosaminidase [Hyphomicrobiales bacterium]
MFASIRMTMLVMLLAVTFVLAIFEAWRLRAQWSLPVTRIVAGASLATAAFGFVVTASGEVQFRSARERVLSADPQQLEKLGRHVIVGYRNRADLNALIERRAIAGIFLSGNYSQGKTIAGMARDIASLQDTRRRQDLPLLWVATDQEGGGVSRLSPPLPFLPSLADVIARKTDPNEREQAVVQYANRQGRDLAAIGVNLNFAPVIDLNYGIVNPQDRLTRISTRAISKDPAVVTDVASTYCATLLQSRVRCTLKHFPGLGRVVGDTHIRTAELNAGPDELALSDWLPFRKLMSDYRVFTMLSHARLTAIDKDQPASVSQDVIGGLLRERWKHDGVLITDDFSMGAITASRDGIAGAAVAALNAGVDLILMSYDPDQYFPLMDALLQADRDGRLHQDVLARSDERLRRAAIFE